VKPAATSSSPSSKRGVDDCAPLRITGSTPKRRPQPPGPRSSAGSSSTGTATRRLTAVAEFGGDRNFTLACTAEGWKEQSVNAAENYFSRPPFAALHNETAKSDDADRLRFSHPLSLVRTRQSPEGPRSLRPAPGFLIASASVERLLDHAHDLAGDGSAIAPRALSHASEQLGIDSDRNRNVWHCG